MNFYQQLLDAADARSLAMAALRDKLKERIVLSAMRSGRWNYLWLQPRREACFSDLDFY